MPAQPDDVAFLVYTSGTTGAPKGAMISNRNLVFQIGNASASTCISQPRTAPCRSCRCATSPNA
jgi:long-subunit acyl-CoA synthetase (AMP-forming)